MAGNCGACGASPAETCNGADDNCNGRTDEGCTVRVFTNTVGPNFVPISSYGYYATPTATANSMCVKLGYASAAGPVGCGTQTQSCGKAGCTCTPNVAMREPNGTWTYSAGQCVSSSAVCPGAGSTLGYVDWIDCIRP